MYLTSGGGHLLPDLTQASPLQFRLYAFVCLCNVFGIAYKVGGFVVMQTCENHHLSLKKVAFDNCFHPVNAVHNVQVNQ